MLCNEPPAITVRTICNIQLLSNRVLLLRNTLGKQSHLEVTHDGQTMQETLKGMCSEAFCCGTSIVAAEQCTFATCSCSGGLPRRPAK